METSDAVGALSGLAHEGRLSIFRALVKAGPEGLAAGEISRRLNILPNTLSASLAVLSNGGLVTSRRAGRAVIYAARFDAMAELLRFLVEDCCGGAPEVCAPLGAVVAQASCCAPQASA